jgi:hypothetical protein
MTAERRQIAENRSLAMPRTGPFRLPLAAGLPVPSSAAPTIDHGAGTQAAGRDAREWQPVSYSPASSAWPLQSRLELAALPGAVPCARLYTRQLLWGWRLATLAETVELLVSEIATNAVNASAGAVRGQSGGPRAGGLPVYSSSWLRTGGTCSFKSGTPAAKRHCVRTWPWRQRADGGCCSSSTSARNGGATCRRRRQAKWSGRS